METEKLYDIGKRALRAAIVSSLFLAPAICEPSCERAYAPGQRTVSTVQENRNLDKIVENEHSYTERT